jgi:hypothetical protein
MLIWNSGGKVSFCMRVFSILNERRLGCANGMGWLDPKVKALLLALPLCVTLAVPSGAITKHAFEGCWENKEKDHIKGVFRALCFDDDEMSVSFWTPSGGIDHSVYKWTLRLNSIILDKTITCKHGLNDTTLQLTDCQFAGEYLKYLHPR